MRRVGSGTLALALLLLMATGDHAQTLRSWSFDRVDDPKDGQYPRRPVAS